MIKIEIKKPIWNGLFNKRCVGIADFRIKDDLEIRISYKNRYGQLSHPNPYRISKLKALTYPIQVINGGIRLHIIPLEDMEEIK